MIEEMGKDWYPYKKEIQRRKRWEKERSKLEKKKSMNNVQTFEVVILKGLETPPIFEVVKKSLGD